MTALAFVYTYDAVVKEENFPAAILAVVDLIPLNIVRNNAMPGESAEQACLRHLRNCFAHGRFQIAVANNNTRLPCTTRTKHITPRLKLTATPNT